jgi:hypothetical protein
MGKESHTQSKISQHKAHRTWDSWDHGRGFLARCVLRPRHGSRLRMSLNLWSF